MDPTTLIGTSGATLILIAFVMNQIGKWTDQFFIYDLVNFIGGALLITYAWILRSYPFLVLNGVWAALSLRDLFIDFNRNEHKHFKGPFFKKWMQ